MKSGFVTILGRPNVGKSTLLNNIIGQKISIISPKSQTTRDSIQGIYSDDDSQVIFVDTPGIHKPKTELDRYMDKTAYYNIRNNDLALLLVDASKPYSEGDDFIVENVRIDVPLIIAFNKIDLTNVDLVSSLKDKYTKAFPDAKIVEIVALNGFNVEELLKIIKDMLPEGPQYYDVNQVTDRDFKFMIQEIIREKMLHYLKEEVPHSVAVICDDVNFNREKNVFAKIVCEKESQKGIIIGKQGKMIKKIGIAARKDIEDLLSHNVNLELKVQVVPDWKDSPSFLARTGYKND